MNLDGGWVSDGSIRPIQPSDSTPSAAHGRVQRGLPPRQDPVPQGLITSLSLNVNASGRTLLPISDGFHLIEGRMCLLSAGRPVCALRTAELPGARGALRNGHLQLQALAAHVPVLSSDLPTHSITRSSPPLALEPRIQLSDVGDPQPVGPPVSPAVLDSRPNPEVSLLRHGGKDIS